MYVMDKHKHWEELFLLLEFAYNNSYQSTIKMAQFEFLYGRPCWTPLSWDQLEDRVLVGPEVIQEMEEQMQAIKQRIKEARDQQKSYVDVHRIYHSYEVGDKVFLWVKPNKSSIKFGKGSKISPRFVRPFKVVERNGPVAYRLALPYYLRRMHDVFHLFVLRHYISDPSHVIDMSSLQLLDEGALMAEPIHIMDHRIRQLRCRTIDQVKVQWDNYSPHSTTWEDAYEMHQRFSYLFDRLDR
jgi:hypothetical protein